MPIYEYIYAAFQKGELTPFYEKMYPELIGYATHLLGEEFSFLAEDCVQDAVFNTYQQSARFTSMLQWKVFLYTCVRNQGISVLRKGMAQQHYLSQVAVDEEDLSVQFIEQETLTLLYEAIESLPEKYREVFELSFEQGLKNAEIAERLQVAEITVKKQKSKLLSLLRTHMESHVDKETLALLLYVLTEV